MSNFVLVPTEELPRVAVPFIDFPVRNSRYPQNWRKMSWLVRRWRGNRCERCHAEGNITVHHKGLDFVGGLRGSRRDKHDLRQENLEVLCQRCHHQAERTAKNHEKHVRYRARRRHRKFGVGTGLIVI